MRALCLLVALLWAAAAAQLPISVFNVTSYGAKGDRRTNDAAAIQRAIDACARSGGGTVYFPAGNFLSGAIVLKSNVTLHLSAGATLWGSGRMADFNPSHLIYARDADNITIEGQGTINGNGDACWEEDYRPKPDRPRFFIELVRCRNVKIRDVRLRNLPGSGIHPWSAMASLSGAFP